MLAVTESIQQNDSEMLKLVSTYQVSSKKLGEMRNCTEFSSKEASPESPKIEIGGRQETEVMETDPSVSDNDVEKTTQTSSSECAVEDHKSLSKYRKETVLRTESEEVPNPVLNFNDQLSSVRTQEELRDLHNITHANSISRTVSPFCCTAPHTTVTPSKELNFKKRTAAKYLASLQKDITCFDEDKWYKCISAPKDLITEIVAGLSITPTLTTTDDYFMFECEEKNTYNCPYRVRIRNDSTLLFCEHNGCHWHDTDAELLDTSSRLKKGWFTCFDGPLILKTPLTASLCVATRNNYQDGYELYDCLYQKKFKCDYKVRVKQIGGYFICDELGSHQHGIEKELGSTTGLPSAFKDVVDVAFYQNWSYSVRQQKLAEAATKFGLVWDRKLTRQIDNRLSYLRRTTNIRRAVELGKQKGMQDDEKE